MDTALLGSGAAGSIPITHIVLSPTLHALALLAPPVAVDPVEQAIRAALDEVCP